MKYSEDKTKDKINAAFNENFILLWQSEKIPKHMAKFYKLAKCVFHGQRTSTMAKLFKIGHEMANLATLDRTTRNETITTRETGNYRRGDYHCYVGQLLHYRAC